MLAWFSALIIVPDRIQDNKSELFPGKRLGGGQAASGTESSDYLLVYAEKHHEN